MLMPSNKPSSNAVKKNTPCESNRDRNDGALNLERNSKFCTFHL